VKGRETALALFSSQEVASVGHELAGNEIKTGSVIEHQDRSGLRQNPSVKPGQGGAYAQVELKNLFTAPANERFPRRETVEGVDVERKDYQFLYPAATC